MLTIEEYKDKLKETKSYLEAYQLVHLQADSGGQYSRKVYSIIDIAKFMFNKRNPRSWHQAQNLIVAIEIYLKLIKSMDKPENDEGYEHYCILSEKTTRPA